MGRLQRRGQGGRERPRSPSRRYVASPRGHGIPLDYRVLTVEGRMPDTFRSAGWEAPADPASALAKLESEGVAIDDRGRAAQSQRFSATDWSQ